MNNQTTVETFTRQQMMSMMELCTSITRSFGLKLHPELFYKTKGEFYMK